MKLVVINIMLCVLGSMAVYVSINIADGSLASKALLRDVRVRSQRLQQAISILESAEHEELISKLDSNFNELKISVAEVMTDAHVKLDVSDVSFEFDISKPVLLLQNDYPIRLLRLALKYKADDSIALAEILRLTTSAASPWPTEVKACEIHRMEADKLLVSCVLDIYYWGLYE